MCARKPQLTNFVNKLLLKIINLYYNWAPLQYVYRKMTKFSLKLINRSIVPVGFQEMQFTIH